VHEQEEESRTFMSEARFVLFPVLSLVDILVMSPCIVMTEQCIEETHDDGGWKMRW
jgi:hypothetical protein